MKLVLVLVPVHDGQPWPISLSHYGFYDHMDTGPVEVGVVEHLLRDGVEYYAIRDGGYRYHPELEPYVGRVMIIWKNEEEERLELHACDPGGADGGFIRVLTEELLN